jgi:hypothetical protein
MVAKLGPRVKMWSEMARLYRSNKAGNVVSDMDGASGEHRTPWLHRDGELPLQPISTETINRPTSSNADLGHGSLALETKIR